MSHSAGVKKNLTTTALRSCWRYGLLTALGYATLVLIHWRHSWVPLSRGYSFPDLGASRKANPFLEACQTVSLCWLYVLYLLTLINWEQRKFDLREILVIGLLPGLLALAALPANSTDILCYIGLGRIAGVYGANPYLHTYSEFSDSFNHFVEWDITMPYGPVMLPTFILGGWVSQHSVLGAVFTLKLIWLGTHCADCFLIYRILRSWRLDPEFGLFLYGLNPLALLELVANGHNDGLMILFGLSAIYALQRRWPGVALWVALLSALVKLPGVFILSSVVVYLVWRREWRGLIRGLLGGAALLLILKATLFPTAASLLSMANTGSYTQNSLHHLLISAAYEIVWRFGMAVDYDTIYLTERRVISALLIIFCLWRWSRMRSLNGLARELAYIFSALLIGQAAWFFPWYVTWLVPFAALTDLAQLRWAVIVFSWTALAIYAFPHFLVAEAPMHNLWAALRIVVAHIPPLVLLARAFRSGEECAQIRSKDNDFELSKEANTEHVE